MLEVKITSQHGFRSLTYDLKTMCLCSFIIYLVLNIQIINNCSIFSAGFQNIYVVLSQVNKFLVNF